MMKNPQTAPTPRQELIAVTSNLISASAGTGKTYQLASRFVALLALGYKAEEMIALTFTRKAAGEFRNRILKALSDGALDLNAKGKPRKKDKNGTTIERNGITARVWETWSGLSIINGRAVPAGNDIPLCPESAHVVKLAAAAGKTPEQLYEEDDALYHRLGLPRLTAATYQNLLSDMVKVMSKLTLSTLDSFFNRIVGSNSLTIGIRKLQPLEPEDTEAERNAVLRDLINQMSTDSEAGELFLQQYEILTGGEGKNMISFLSEQIKLYLSLYRNINATSAWGDAEAFDLHPCNGADIIPAEQWEAYAQELNELYQEVCAEGGNLTKKAEAAITPLLKNLKKGEFDFLHKHTKIDNTRAGSAFNKFVEAPGKTATEERLAAGMERIINEVKAIYLQAVINKTKSLFYILHRFASAYRDHMRSTGKVGFDDIAMFAYHLMNPELNKLTTQPEQRSYAASRIRYNMDAAFNHWMLDEFQDTSNMQFDTLRPVLTEIAQCERKTDTKAATRSIFVVGDDKQSIYGFRTGDTDVFRSLQSDDPWKSVLKPSLLEKSFRSAPEIMGQNGFINKMFEALNAIEQDITDRDNIELEKADCHERLTYDNKLLNNFTHHQSATNKTGYVRLSVLPEQEDNEETRNAFYNNIALLLRDELTDENSKPRNGISIAILTRSNPEAEELEAKLREKLPRLPLVRIGDDKIAATSQAGELLLSFFLWLRHPDDNYRLALIKSSPLRSLFTPLTSEEMSRLTPYEQEQEINRKNHGLRLRHLENHGYAATVQALLNCLSDEGRNISNGRTAQIWQTEAHAFDCTGGTLQEWISRIVKAGATAASSSRYVQIMTMHKSKGLEFDAVILPYIATDAEDKLKDMGYFSLKDESGNINALLLNPGSAQKRDAWKSVFSPLCAEQQQKSRKEAYNLLYVAATRAKYANYIICHGNLLCEVKTNKNTGTVTREWKSAARSTAGMLRQMLCYPPFSATKELTAETLSARNKTEVLLSYGNNRWFEAPDFTEKAQQEPTEAQPLLLPQLSHRYRRKRVSPSALAQAEDKSAPENEDIPTPRYADNPGTDFGTEVHACWEEIPWLEAPLPAWFSAPQSTAQKIVIKALQQAEIAELFTPRPGQEVYNEQAVEAIDSQNNAWISGTIDRLILTHDATGNIIAAHIIDFKTNKPIPRDGSANFEEWLMAHYKGQMRAYKQLIQRAFHLPAQAVTISLLSCPRTGRAQVLTYADDCQMTKTLRKR